MTEQEQPGPRDIVAELQGRFGPAIIARQETRDDLPTFWVSRYAFHDVLSHLKTAIPQPYRTLYDLTAVDERSRLHRTGLPEADFTVVYTLRSYERNADLRLKVGLVGDYPLLQTITDLWPAANWYEREAWDMFGITFENHPNLRRILMPPGWKGHPLRKEHPARATEMGPYHLTEEKKQAELELLQFVPEEWGLERQGPAGEYMFLNMGPQHPGTHGVLRVILQLDGEEIVDAVPDIGFHHRGAEKMGERQTWHTYVPYTDRVDYLSGVVNNMAYLMSLERLAGIDVPDRAQVIRVMLTELYRIANHLVWYGTFAQDVGQLSPVFYMFSDRERLFDITEAITGGRMHPSWFRIGGVAADLPRGWQEMVGDFLEYMPRRLREYDKLVMGNAIFKGRTKGIGRYSLEEAMEWGATGPGLRACGLAWDLRKMRPYSGYDQFEFEVPTATNGDGYDRALVRVEEMRQSLRIIRQCLEQMPPGPYKSSHPLATPPIKPRTMRDIETLITHFLHVSWGPVIPAGEAMVPTEAAKGDNGYYLISDGNDVSYRTRIRTPSFAHMQMIPLMSRGLFVADLISILGSLDFVLSDVDR